MDIKDKAIEYAYNNATLGLSPEMAIRAYIAGATEALQSQWHETSNPPKHNHAVIVKCEINPDDFTEGYSDDASYTVAIYKDGLWNVVDEYYYDVPILLWMEIPSLPKPTDK